MVGFVRFVIGYGIMLGMGIIRGGILGSGVGDGTIRSRHTVY